MFPKTNNFFNITKLLQKILSHFTASFTQGRILAFPLPRSKNNQNFPVIMKFTKIFKNIFNYFVNLTSFNSALVKESSEKFETKSIKFPENSTRTGPDQMIQFTKASMSNGGEHLICVLKIFIFVKNLNLSIFSNHIKYFN